MEIADADFHLWLINNAQTIYNPQSCTDWLVSKQTGSVKLRKIGVWEFQSTAKRVTLLFFLIIARMIKMTGKCFANSEGFWKLLSLLSRKLA